MSRGYRLTPEAQANVEEICSFIAEDDIDAANRVLEAFEHAFGLLAANRGIGHTREDLTHRPVKSWVVYSYLVVYDTLTTPLTNVAVLHGARDVARVLRNTER